MDKTWKKIIWENVEVIIIALLIVIPIRYFVIQPFIVKGSSMEPNFYTNDYLIIDEISYRFRQPQRYEVIVLKAPNHPEEYYIKRIIGLPNETVVINNGQVKVITPNNETINIDESYLPPNTLTSGNLTITLKPNQYFALGDNRAVSYDSRNWGPFDKSLIVGRVWLRLWPLNRITIFNNYHNAYAK